MNLVQYFLTEPHGSRQRMANNLGVTKAWFSQVTQGRVKPSIDLCKRIEQETNGKVSRKDLRPDLYV